MRNLISSSRSIMVVSFDCDRAAYAAAAAAATSGPEPSLVARAEGATVPVRAFVVVCIAMPFGGRMFVGGPKICAVDEAGNDVMFS